MKLAEALRLRADNKVRLKELESRIESNAVTQEGEKPTEDVSVLLAELEKTIDSQEHLIRTINRTNSATELEPGITITDALATRDMLTKRVHLLTSILSDVRPTGLFRSRSTELRSIVLIDVAGVRTRIDGLAADLRRLDMQIQERNWTVELIE